MSATQSISRGHDVIERQARARPIVAGLCLAFLGGGCNEPDTAVIVDNDYSPSAERPIVVYHAYWQANSFAAPIPPGSSSAPQSTLPASTNTAYAVLAPGWDPTGATPPTSLVVVQSQSGFAVHLDDTLHIPVDDTTFAGNCAAASFLTQSQTDFITQLVFPCTFAGLHYDAATCTATALADGGSNNGCDAGNGGDASNDGDESGDGTSNDGNESGDGTSNDGDESGDGTSNDGDESGDGNEGGGP